MTKDEYKLPKKVRKPAKNTDMVDRELSTRRTFCQLQKKGGGRGWRIEELKPHSKVAGGGGA